MVGLKYHRAETNLKIRQMPKFKKELIFVRDPHDRDNFVQIKVDINIGADGQFYVKLPDQELNLLKEALISTSYGPNRKSGDGYVYAKTYEELVSSIKNMFLEYFSWELESESIFLMYAIEVRSSYALSDNGDVCPNPSFGWTGSGESKWRHGNVDIHSQKPSPHGFLVYAEPKIRKVYKYRSGKTKEVLSKLYQDDVPDSSPNLKWLAAVPCMYPPSGVKPQEIEYTEEVAAFFVNMIKSIAMMNERVKDFLHPEAILEIAKKGQKLIG